MKILKDNKIYVQKNDIAYLNVTNEAIPASIYLKVYGRGITIIDDSNRYEFIEFTDPKEIEFFQRLDWIIDYNEVKDLTEEQIIQLGKEVAAEKNRRADEFNAQPETYRRETIERVLAEQELFDFKMYSLRDIIMFKRGELTFKLPKGVSAPSTNANSQEQSSVKQETGIKRFVKSIFIVHVVT